MTDLAQLESEILSDIAAAGDEAALEAVRVAALGKKGSISALLATLGKMSPDERTPVSDLEKLTRIYRGILDRYFG